MSDHKFRIFIIFHNDINLGYYHGSFIRYITFVNVTPNNPSVKKLTDLGCHVINQYEFKNFISLGKQYAESEVIYNIYKNPYLTEDVDYVGFMQYDMHTHDLSKEELDSLIDSYKHIAFDEHLIKSDYQVGYLMDSQYPEKWIGRGKNCYLSILEDYNRFYRTNHTLKEIIPGEINLCCTFLLEKDHYNNMMAFISNVIESKRLDIFDTKRAFRMQGGLLERYFGVWLTINRVSYFHRPIEHVFNTTVTKENRSLIKRTVDFIKRKIR